MFGGNGYQGQHGAAASAGLLLEADSLWLQRVTTAWQVSLIFFFLQFLCNIGTLRSESTNSLYVCMLSVCMLVLKCEHQKCLTCLPSHGYVI